MSASRIGGRLDGLQGLRGVACLAVVAFHAAEYEAVLRAAPSPALGPFRHSCYAGVDLFFVISGFILTWINWGRLGRPSAVPGHLFRRAWRVYPLLWAAWLLSNLALIAFHRGVPHGYFIDLPQTLLLLPTPGGGAYHTLPPAWSLAYEVMFYAAFTLAFLLPRVLFVPLVLLWGGACLARHLTAPPMAGLLPPDYPVGVLVIEFLGGCLVAAAIRFGATVGGRSALLLGAGWFLAVTGLEAAGVTHAAFRLGDRVALFAPAAMLAVYGTVAHERRTGRVWSPVWLRRCGDASYSIYLFHFIILTLVTQSRYFRRTDFWPNLAWIAVSVGACVALGFLAHRWVERPLAALPGRFGARRRPAPAEPIRRAA